jgi:2-succinyl-5-enolpyruvyl-6-hydroxy-3-cyclohexene-1-carboxylate synthase
MPYSNKGNVNILTTLLVAHGIRHVVACPGSRNAPLVHNFGLSPRIECHPVTDERSAGFYALGMSQALTKPVCVKEPVVVCVTSGTALLNLAPAIAEAYYQRWPLVVISADRPPQWIDQLDGQTLPQPDALGRFVAKAVSLPEPRDDEERWYCNRLVNEALLKSREGFPVHINVPIAEPLFSFTTQTLPAQRKIEQIGSLMNNRLFHETFLSAFFQARKPMVIVGQTYFDDSCMAADLYEIGAYAVVLSESLTNTVERCHFDEVLPLLEGDDSYKPDFILYLGGTLVSKRLKRFIRGLSDVSVWSVSEDGAVYDTFMHLTGIIKGSVYEATVLLMDAIEQSTATHTETFVERWNRLLQRASAHADAYEPAYSQMAAVKWFERSVGEKKISKKASFHYANSAAIRLANIYACHYVYCNRGVNGIDGSLSTAAGFSLVSEHDVYCVIGDLSFFYDQNARWNQNLKGNFRVLLLNNGKGGIFNMLPGLEQSPVCDSFVAASHQTSAEGICQQNHVVYLRADDMEQMQKGIETLLSLESDRPVLLEVFTNASEDESAYRLYFKQLQTVQL